MAQYVYGKSVVYSLLKNHKDIEVLYVQTPRNNDDLEKLALSQSINVEHLSRSEMDKLVAGNHQGYIAKTAEYKLYSVEEIVAQAKAKQYPLIVALDGIEDPHNLGAILRSACCVGADGVIIEKNRSVSLNGTVAKVSVGAIDVVKVAMVTNLTNTLNQLKQQGYWVVGSDATNAVDYRSVDYKMPVVLVIGSEGYGMRRLVRENCDFVVSLPMESDIGSLNASVATGILLYQIYNHRFPL